MPGAPSMPTSLADAFYSQTFSDGEKERLGALIREGGIAAQVIKKHVGHTKSYQAFRKVEKISGFRLATPAYDKQAIRLIVEALGDNSHRLHQRCWERLYSQAAAAYVEKEHTNLNRLLRAVPPPADASDATEMVRAVCTNALEFEVSKEDIRKFYELWGTPRLANFEDLLPLCDQRDEASAQRRALGALSADLEKIKGTVATQVSLVDAQAESLVELRKASSGERGRLKVQEAEIERLSKTIAEVQKKAQPGEARIKELEERIGRLAGRSKDEDDALARDLASKLHQLASETKSSIVRAIGALRTELTKTISDDLSAFAKELEQKRAAVKSVSALRVEPAPLAPGGPPPAWTSPGRTIKDSAELRRVLSTAFKARGVAPGAAIRIHSALAAGVLPIVVGPTALLALDAYSHAVCGGHATTLHVGPTLMAPGEIFGRMDHGSGRFIVHPAGLLDLLESATASRGSAIAILEGINRGPTESYLLPLLQIRARRARVPLFHRRSADPSASMVSPNLEWPSNLLLAATAVEGPTSLPICRDLLAYSVVVEVEACEQAPGGSQEQTSELSFAPDLSAPSEVPSSLLEDLFATWPDAQAYRRTLSSFGGMLARFESDSARIRAALLDSVLLPLVATLDNDDEREEASEALTRQLADDEVTRLQAMLRRLRRRIG